MEASERRQEILKHLCRERSTTIYRLAVLFEVSERTIQRDINVLCLKHPIYTQVGRYNGGVYIHDGYYSERLYLLEDECHVLKKVLSFAHQKQICNLNDDETKILKNIIKNHSKPKNERKKL